MRRCIWCHRIVWFWQTQDSRRVTAKDVLRWHGSCYRRNVTP